MPKFSEKGGSEGMRSYEDALAEIQRTVGDGPFAADWDSLSAVEFPRWYTDGKFGIFLCWGPIAVPGYRTDWYAREMYREGTAEHDYHVKTYGGPEKFGFKEFIPSYTMGAFDPLEWASLFRRAGAQFVAPIAEYHDGFAEYDSSFTEYSAVRMGPKRDLLGEMGSALERCGLVLGATSHYAENWWFYNGGTKLACDVGDPTFSDLYGPAQREEIGPNDEFLTRWLCRTCDFVDKYRPQLVWFDWWIETPAFERYLKTFAAFYYNRGVQWGRQVAINYKCEAMRPTAAVLDLERGQLKDVRHPFWQVDTSMARDTWFWTRDPDYKPADELIGDLVDIVSKNGALLLSIGPRPDGTIPEEEIERLQAIGRFLSVNGEAIYGTRPWKIFGEGPTEVGDGSFVDKEGKCYTSEDIRFTVRPSAGAHGELLYATVLAWPDGDEVLLRSLAAGNPLCGPIEKVELLGYRGEVGWHRSPAGLAVKVPATRPSEHAFSLRITGKAIITSRRPEPPTHEGLGPYGGQLVAPVPE